MIPPAQVSKAIHGNMINNSNSRRHPMFLLFAVFCLVQHADCRLHDKAVVELFDNEQNETERELQTGRWYVDWTCRHCVQDCPLDLDYPSCGGRVDPEEADLFVSPEDCCANSPLNYLSFNECMRGAITDDGNGYNPSTFAAELRHARNKNSNINKNKKTSNKKKKNSINSKGKKQNGKKVPNKNKIGKYSQGTYDLEPIDDAFIDRYNPSRNYDIDTLQVNTLQTNYGGIDTLIQFKLPSSLDDNNLIEATLELYILEQCGGNMNIEVVSGDWSENKVTWNNAPSKTGPKSTETRVKQNTLRKNDRIEIDVTNAVEWSTKVKHDDYITFRISVPEEADGCLFASRENNKGNSAPSLELRLGEKNGNLKQNYGPRPKKPNNPKPKPKKTKNKPRRKKPLYEPNPPVRAPNPPVPRPKPKPKPRPVQTYQAPNPKPSNVMLNYEPRPAPQVNVKVNVKVPQPYQVPNPPERPDTVDKLARRNKPCDAYHGAHSCFDDGYMCIGANGYQLVGNGIGICRLIVTPNVGNGIDRFARRNQPCDELFGEHACLDDGYFCLGADGSRLVGAGLGICGLPPPLPIVYQNAGEGEACDASLGTQACASTDLVCRGVTGLDLELVGRGTGICVRSFSQQAFTETITPQATNRDQGSGQYFVNAQSGSCLQDCEPGPFGCARVPPPVVLYNSIDVCCSVGQSWVDISYCKSRSIGGYSNGWLVDYGSGRCVRDCDPNDVTCSSSEEHTDYSETIYFTTAECCQSVAGWAPNCVAHSNG